MDDHGAPAGPATTANRCGEVGATPQSLRRGQHDYLAFRPDSAGSGRQPVAALGAAGRDDGAAGAGTHAQPETVGLRTPAVVRLVGALAHVKKLRLRTTPRGHRQPTRHFSRARHSNRSTVRSADRRATIVPVHEPARGLFVRGRSSFCATGESFRSRKRSPGWPVVEGTAAALLACASAGHSTVHIPLRIGQNRIRR